jgi:outer membrane lipoprotein-sorting protein
MTLAGAVVFAFIVAFSGMLMAAPPAITEEIAKSAAAILKKSDDMVNVNQDQEYVTQMKLVSGTGKVEKVLEFKVLQKGGTKRLVRFLKPGDVKGLSVLVLDSDTTYVYLPQFSRTRRVAAHTSKQSFMGTDFTEQENSIIRYDESFDPAFVKKEGVEYVLKLTPKKGKEFAFAYIMIWIDENNGLQTRMEYYNAQDLKLKTQTRGGLKILDGVETQTKVVMTDHIRKHSTEIEILSTKENQGLKDDLFTQRNLEWGN